MSRLIECAVFALCCIIADAGLAADLTEQDYFGQLPEVLTVTRLAQPLAETPGAVTIIDRETIRRSGARELADVLRLVPGYMVGGFNGANPLALYHAPLDDTGSRNLVLIDGRPVYSAYYIGDTHRGMMGVLLDDIERIEVLRGANSAAYGANAMFGVINIVTRHTADTRGAEVAVTGGDGGIADSYARVGWGDDRASFRLTAGHRQDDGYANAYDDKRASQLHFRGDLHPATDQDVMLSAGIEQLEAGDGYPLGSANNKSGGNPLRTATWRDFYLHGVWQRQLSGTDQLKLTANFDEENFDDAFVYAADPSVTVSTSGRGRRLNLELQHQIGLAPTLRAVWGAGYNYEEALSPPIYNRSDAVSSREVRLFGNLEWRLHPRWLINAGGFWGNHSWTGTYFSPRLMANFLLTPDQTLRIGATKSSRVPSLFELAADVRWNTQSTAASNPYRLFALLGVPVRPAYADGTVSPEALDTQEVGYFGNFRDWRLTLDVRAYVETMKDAIDAAIGTAPGYVNPLTLAPLPVQNFVNGQGFKAHGVEYQLRWKPLADTEVWLNQSFERLNWDDGGRSNLPPVRSTAVALFQKLPRDLDFSLMYYSVGAMSWGTVSDTLPAQTRIDARLAMPFRVGATRCEAAIVVQEIDGGQPEYLAGKQFSSARRAFGTLRLEF